SQLNYPRAATAEARIGLRYVRGLRDQAHWQQCLRDVSIYIGRRIWGDLRAAGTSVVYVSGSDVVRWQREIRVIENVEKLRAQLQIEPLANACVLDNGEIHVTEARPKDRVAAQVPESSVSWLHKRQRIE